MTQTLKIKRSTTTASPSTLENGELAYSSNSDKLFIGRPGGTSGDIDAVGGKFFTDLLDHTAGTLTASSAVIMDSGNKIDIWNVDNITINGNEISSTDINGNLNITPNGTGSILLDGQLWPQTAGTNGYVLKTDGINQLAWGPPPASTFTISNGSSTDEFSTGGTLSFIGGTNLTTAITNDTITFNGLSDSDIRALFSASPPITYSAGAFSIVDGAISNAKLANSSLTIGSTLLSLGGTSTSLAGLTELTIDNININGNEISSTGDLSLNPSGSNVITVNGALISGVGTPITDTDAANKLYVDSVAQGLNVHNSVYVATTATLASTTGGTVTYSNGTAGVGATLVTTGSFTTIDGVSVAVVGRRVLVKDEVDPIHNGIYVYTNSTTITRALDGDSPADYAGGDFVFISNGTINNDTGWVQTENITTIGTDTIIWSQFSGAGTYIAGAGLTLTGSEFIVNVAGSGGIEIVTDALQLKSTIAGTGLTYGTGVLNVIGTTDRITADADAIDIASTYVGQDSITTLGTITTGTWSATAISAIKGGTGQTTYATGDLLYASATNTLSKLTKGTAGQVLVSDGTTLLWESVDGGTF